MNRKLLYFLSLLNFFFIGCEKDASNGPSSSVQGNPQPLIACTSDVTVTVSPVYSWSNLYSVNFHILTKVNGEYRLVGSGAATTIDLNSKKEESPFTAEVAGDNDINTCSGIPLLLGVEYYIVCDAHFSTKNPDLLPIQIGIHGYYTQHVKVKFTNAVHGDLRINLDDYYKPDFSLVEVGSGITASIGGNIGSIY